MNTVWPVLLGGGIGALGTFLLGATGLLKFLVSITRGAWQDHAKALHQQQSDTQAASATVLNQALDLANALSSQVKDLRAENLSLEQHQLDETRSLRERIRNLEARVGELEADLETLRGENTWLKAQLYDQQQPPHTSSRNRGAITPLRSASPQSPASTTQRAPRRGGTARTRPRSVSPSSASDTPDEGA